jgi:peptide/nickel transport system ATP-binding protein
MLQAENISFRYHQQTPLLENINFHLSSGEIIGLPGPSGCGKSTLGRLLAGYHVPQSGTITYKSNPMPDDGYCPVQMIFQHPELAVNPRWPLRKILEEGNNDYEDLLYRFGISKRWLDRYPHELSGGELQRIILVRAMNNSTKFLVADEMTASLDPNTQALIWQTVLPWVKENQVGLLAISHDLKLLQQVADRIDETFTGTVQ